jgi:hypothetical protein
MAKKGSDSVIPNRDSIQEARFQLVGGWDKRIEELESRLAEAKDQAAFWKQTHESRFFQAYVSGKRGRIATILAEFDQMVAKDLPRNQGEKAAHDADLANLERLAKSDHVGQVERELDAALKSRESELAKFDDENALFVQDMIQEQDAEQDGTE